MAYSLYGSWSINEAKTIGKKFIGKCLANYGYENKFNIGKEYLLEISEPILPLSPLCIVYANGKKVAECHLERFEKIKEIKHERSKRKPVSS